ncbi:MFS transporter [Streptomyces sp. NPDC127084]|uniref:MFS transporter n=1 Tax=Streptomyces sp. NPDC127084 TaxID=3347133 RepID=UPI0036655766
MRILVVALAGGVLFGYSISAMNQILDEVDHEFGLTTVSEGVVVSSLVVGALVGCLAAGAVTDRWGRRTMLCAAGVMGTVAASVCAVAASQVVLISGRLLLGLAVGVTTAVAPVLVAELASIRKRGSSVTAYQLATAVGALAALLLGLHQSAHEEWRWMFAANAVPAIALGAGVILIPPGLGNVPARRRGSTAFGVPCAAQGYDQVGKAYIPVVAGGGSQERPAGWSKLRRPPYRLPVVLALSAALMNALVGVGAVVYYSTLVFSLAGVKGRLGAEVASLSVGACNVAVSVLSLWLIQRHSRLSLLTSGLTGIIGSLTAAAVCLMAFDSEVTGVVTVVSLLAFMACFAFSAGPLAWLIIAEVLPTEIRAPIAGVALAANWAANLLVTLAFPIVVGIPGSPARVGAAFLFFAVLTIGFLLLFRRTLPETKDRALDVASRQKV